MSFQQNIMYVKASTLEAEVARTIGKWVEPSYNISHVVFGTTSSRVVSGPPDHQLNSLLRHGFSVHHVTYQRGSTTFLRQAEVYVENNRGARVLVVCSEITALSGGGLSLSRTTYREPRPRNQERIAEAGVKELQAQLKAAEILLKVKSAEVDVLRRELGLPREKQLEARTHTMHGESSRAASRSRGYIKNN